MKPADYIVIDPPSEGTADAVFAGVATRLAQRKRERQWTGRAVIGAGALAVAAVATVLIGRPQELGTGAVVESRSETVTVRLSDGSEALIEPLSQLNVLTASPLEVRVALPSGSATFEVTHNPSRQFAVVSGDIEVRVRGTRFTVRTEPPNNTNSAQRERAEVSVERGVVDVLDRRSGERIARLTAGARWYGGSLLAKLPLEAAGALGENSPNAPPDSPKIVEPTASPVRDAGAEPKRLFDQATALRRDGDPTRAIQLYAELVRRFPRDEYSRVAALELGRMRLRVGDQPRAAARALEQAIKTDPQSPLQPDALAQLVAAYEQSGDLARCRKNKARYLQEFPQGPHASEVRRRCP